jgi:hypothetical protein
LAAVVIFVSLAVAFWLRRPDAILVTAVLVLTFGAGTCAWAIVEANHAAQGRVVLPSALSPLLGLSSVRVQVSPADAARLGLGGRLRLLGDSRGADVLLDLDHHGVRIVPAVDMVIGTDRWAPLRGTSP